MTVNILRSPYLDTRSLFTVLILVCFAFGSVAQQTDSVVYIYNGTLGQMEADLDEIIVHPVCKCVGECQCNSRPGDHQVSRSFVNADQLLKSLNEVDLISRGNFAAEPVVNGISGDRISMTIDGMKIFGACTDKMDPISSYIEPNNLRAIQVQSNGISANGSSTGGAINFETRSANIDTTVPWKAQVGSAYSSVSNRLDKLASVQYSHSRWAILVNGVHKKSNNYKAGGGGEIPYTQFEKWNIASSLNYKLKANQFIKVTHLSDRGLNIGYAALPMDVAYANTDLGSFSYLVYPSENISRIEIKSYFNRVKHSMDDTEREEVFMHMDMPGQTRTFGAFANVKWNKNHENQVIRFDYFNVNARAEMTMYPSEEPAMFMLTWPDIVRDNLVVLVSRDIVDAKSWKIRVGANTKYVRSKVVDEFGQRQASVFGQDLSGPDHRLLTNLNIAGSRKLEKGKLWFDLSETQRGPTFTEQYGFYIFNAYDGYDYVGDVNLKTETAVRSSIGYESILGPVKVKTSCFAMSFANYILPILDENFDAMTFGANGVKILRNVSNTRMYGGNLNLDYKPSRQIRVDLSSSYVYGKTGEGDPLPLIPPLRTRLSAAWETGQVLVKADLEKAESQNRINSTFGELSTPSYTIFNVAANWSKTNAKSQVKLDVGIRNVFDSYYRTHLTWGGIPNPGRNLFVNVMIDL